MIFLARLVDFRPKFFETYLRPLVSCAVMGIVVYFVYKLLLPMAGNLISVAISIAFGVVVYFVAMILTHGITKEDIPALMETGITGIALSGSILRAENPIEEMKEFIKTIHLWKN